jgi:type VI secretion system secreted protein Hcp
MAVVDYFLKIDGIDGESEDQEFKGNIECLSWSWGETQSGTMSYGGGGGAGKVAMQDFHFTMRVCKASPKLLEACASGEHIAKAVLTARKAGKTQQKFLKMTFSDFLVSSFQTGGSGAGDVVPVDQISLNYAKIEYEYSPQDSKGSLTGAIRAGWDLKKNVKC